MDLLTCRRESPNGDCGSTREPSAKRIAHVPRGPLRRETKSIGCNVIVVLAVANRS